MDGNYLLISLRRDAVEVVPGDCPTLDLKLILTVSKVAAAAAAAEAEEAAVLVEVAPPVHLLDLLDHLDPRLARGGLQGAALPAAVVPGVRSKLTPFSSMSTSTNSCSSAGSVARPSYGGGKYYGGGATSAYRAGGRSPRGLLPVAIGLGAAAIIFPGIWLYGAYNYPYNRPYSFRNSTRRANDTDDRLRRRQDDQNVTLPVTCLCVMYSACGCDENDDPSYLDSIIGDGSNLNASLVHIGPVNGTETIALNGTLPNATDSESDTSGSSASSPTSPPPTSSAVTTQRILEMSGIWVLGGVVGAAVWLL